MMEETPLQYSEPEDCEASDPSYDLFAGEQSSDSDSGETGYISSDESSSETDDEEIFAGKRTREAETPSRTGFAAPPARKTQKRSEPKPSGRKNPPKPVKNPLSEEKKKQIREKKAKIEKYSVSKIKG